MGDGGGRKISCDERPTTDLSAESHGHDMLASFSEVLGLSLDLDLLCWNRHSNTQPCYCEMNTLTIAHPSWVTFWVQLMPDT